MKDSDTLLNVRKSFSLQAENFETKDMNFSKKDYLDHTIKAIELSKTDNVLEVAAGTCACGRSAAPFAGEVTCLDATEAMLAVGKKEAERLKLSNMKFILGLAEDLPFDDGTFDVVLSRLAFHHFAEMEAPFAEMARVLRPGGKLVIIDMEAARDDLRNMEDHLERLRDFSHVRCRSADELEGLYTAHHFVLTKKESVKIPVSLSAWLALTKTPDKERKEITAALEEELAGGKETGFAPYREKDGIHFIQRWLFLMGRKQDI